MEDLKNEIVLEITPYESVHIDFDLGTTLKVPVAKYAQRVMVKFDYSVIIRSTSLVKSALRTIRIIEVLARYHLISRRYADRVIRRCTMRTTTESSKTYEAWMII